MMLKKQDGSSRAFEPQQDIKFKTLAQHSLPVEQSKMKQVEDKSDKVHFFENSSKYIPLRHFNQEHGETYAEQCEYFVNNKKT